MSVCQYHAGPDRETAAEDDPAAAKSLDLQGFGLRRLHAGGVDRVGQRLGGGGYRFRPGEGGWKMEPGVVRGPPGRETGRRGAVAVEGRQDRRPRDGTGTRGAGPRAR